MYQAEMVAAVQRELADLDVATSVVEFAPGRPSPAAVLAGGGDGPSLVLNGHMDTVPVGDASCGASIRSVARSARARSAAGGRQRPDTPVCEPAGTAS